LFTFLLLVALLLLWYRPVENFTQRHLFAPVVTGGRVVIVQPGASLRGLQRGDWVAYSLAERSIEDAVIFHGGVGLGPVLAKAGDHIVFSPGGFTVNETPHAALPHMPAAGEWIVPEKHWFIWPNLGISGHGNVGESNINRTFMALADVAPSQYWGRPFRHWFWRKQTLP
jgi:signal peptidase I